MEGRGGYTALWRLMEFRPVCPGELKRKIEIEKKFLPNINLETIEKHDFLLWFFSCIFFMPFYMFYTGQNPYEIHLRDFSGAQNEIDESVLVWPFSLCVETQWCYMPLNVSVKSIYSLKRRFTTWFYLFEILLLMPLMRLYTLSQKLFSYAT